MYPGAVHIFDLFLDPHYVEEISFHDPSVITSIPTIEEVVTYLNCPAAHFMDFNDAAPVYIAVNASHPLARQFLPAESPPQSIVFKAYPAGLSTLSMTMK